MTIGAQSLCMYLFSSFYAVIQSFTLTDKGGILSMYTDYKLLQMAYLLYPVPMDRPSLEIYIVIGGVNGIIQ